VIRSMISSMVRSMITTMINPDSGAVKRIFIDFDASSSSSAVMTTPIAMPNNFTVGGLAVLPTASTNYTILGQDASSLNYFKVLSTGFASINIDGSVVTSLVAATKDRKIRRYDVRLNGNDFEFLEDSAIIDTVTDAVAAAKTLTLNAVGESNNLDFFDNVLADVILDNNGTITSWDLDEATSNTETNNEGGNVLTYNSLTNRELFTLNDNEDWIGQELVVNGGFNTDTDWAKGVGWTIGGGLLNSTAVTNTSARNTGLVVVGNTHLNEFDVISLTSGKVELQGGANATDRDAVGSYSEILVAVFDDIDIRANFTTGFVGSVDNASVKRILEVA